MANESGRPRARTTLDYWPVVVNVIENGHDLSEIEDVLAVNEVALSRGPQFVTIRDFRTHNQQVTALQRKRLAQWQDDNWKLIQARCLGVANIMPSPVVRGVLRAVFWMSTPPTREEVFDTTEEAVTAAYRWAKEANLLIPPSFEPGLLIADLLANKI